MTPAAVEADVGWEVLHTNDEVVVARKVLEGEQCLRGRTRVDLPVDALLAVAVDLHGEQDWSPEKIAVSEILSRTDDELAYWQLLDIPGWALVADRYWVLRAEVSHVGGSAAFRWERFDWRAAYPQVLATLAEVSPDAIEPPVNVGSWRFDADGDGTIVTYAVCADPGGSLPTWLQRRVAVMTLPDTVTALIGEARRRSGR